MSAACTIAASLPTATSRGRYFIPQSGATCSRPASTWRRAARMRSAMSVDRLDLEVAEAHDADRDDLVRQLLQDGEVEVGLGRLDDELVGGAVVELGQDRIAGRPVVDHVRVAEARVQRGRAADAVEGAVDDLDRVLARLLRPRLDPRLVDLDHVGARGEEVADLLVHRDGEVHRERADVAVVLVDGLLAHRERAGQRDLHLAVGVAPQELEVADLHRLAAADLPGDPRDLVGLARAAEDLGGVVEVHAVERGREAVGVALPADLAVGDDVDAGALHVADGEEGRVVLRGLEEVGGDTPEVGCADARGEAVAQHVAVEEPVRLGEAAHDRRGEDSIHVHDHRATARRTRMRSAAHATSAIAARPVARPLTSCQPPAA